MEVAQWSDRLAPILGGREIKILRLIIAVACERDLSSGIQDSYPLPIFGIINRRPHGPCYDTQVDLEKVEQALTTFLLPAAVAAAQAPRPQPA